MKEGSEGDGGGSSDDIPTSRDADSTVSNYGTKRPRELDTVSNGVSKRPRMGLAPAALTVHEGLPLGGTKRPRDHDTISNGDSKRPRMDLPPAALTVHDGLPLGGTTLANALLGIALDRGSTNGDNSGSNGDALLGIHSTNVKGGVKSDSNGQNRDKAFVCNICNRSFGYKHVLQNHERTHTGEKPFECKECHKRFTRDHHLKTHMRLHTGEKPYRCSYCERQFVQVANLRRHLRVHTGERPYACEVCSSKFSDSNQLKAHGLIHRGLKPFECEKCNGHFRRRHHLVHHKCPMDEANLGKPRRGRRPKAYDELPTLLPPVKQERSPTTYDDRPTMLPPMKQERLPNTYDKLPTLLLPVKQERLSPDLPPPPPQTVSLTSVITRGPSPSLIPQPAHMQQGLRRNHHLLHHHLLGLGSSNGVVRFHHDTMQTGPLDMTVSSSASAPVSVIVPRIPYHHSRPNNMDGVLDLSNSRSDSEAEPIEEEVDEEDDCLDEGVDSDSDEEQHLQMIACTWEREENNHNMHRQHVEDLLRGNNGDNRYDEDNRYDNEDNRYDNEGENSNLALQLTTTS